MTKLCCTCHDRPAASSTKKCNQCHAAYMREWRKTHPMSPAQKIKDACRHYANVYLSRGKITRKPCEKCGSVNSQMHHPDYAKPLKVKWLCRPCHLRLHRNDRRAPAR